jgi:glucose-1-phosphate adenylyltransferase
MDTLQNIFYSNTGPIYTKTKDTAPAKYCKDAVVKNSLIANGCII